VYISSLGSRATENGVPSRRTRKGLVELPSHIVGVLSIVVLLVACVARYAYRLEGAWRTVYTIGAVVGLYFNVFVLVVQLFLKVPALTALAPTQSEPPFAIAQLLVLAAFVALGIQATRRFTPRVTALSGDASAPTMKTRAGV
jgi:hypothetical protein